MTTVAADQIWKIKQGDQVITEWEAGIDLTNATELNFHAARICDGPPDIEIVGTLNADNPFIVDVLVTTADSQEVGYYYVEIETHWPNGEIITLPAEGFCALIISSDLGPGS